MNKASDRLVKSVMVARPIMSCPVGALKCLQQVSIIFLAFVTENADFFYLTLSFITINQDYL